jgi:hypothetical protein
VSDEPRGPNGLTVDQTITDANLRKEFGMSYQSIVMRACADGTFRLDLGNLSADQARAVLSTARFHGVQLERRRTR